MHEIKRVTHIVIRTLGLLPKLRPVAMDIIHQLFREQDTEPDTASEFVAEFYSRHSSHCEARSCVEDDSHIIDLYSYSRPLSPSTPEPKENISCTNDILPCSGDQRVQASMPVDEGLDESVIYELPINTQPEQS